MLTQHVDLFDSTYGHDHRLTSERRLSRIAYLVEKVADISWPAQQTCVRRLQIAAKCARRGV